MATNTTDTPLVRPDSTIVNAVKAMALLRESPVGIVGALIVVFFVLLAIFAPLVAPFDPNATILPFAFPGTAAPDGGLFLFGTDHLGRDILSRIIWGGQRVLFYATVATISAYIVGIIMGLAAGVLPGLPGRDHLVLRQRDSLVPDHGPVRADHRQGRRLGAQHHLRGGVRVRAGHHAYRPRG